MTLTRSAALRCDNATPWRNEIIATSFDEATIRGLSAQPADSAHDAGNRRTTIEVTSLEAE